MGCCASTNHKFQHPHSSAGRSDSFRHSKAAPPPEEETVKEVLSETPTPKPPVSKIEEDEKKWGCRPSLHKIRETDDNAENPAPLIATEDVYEVSEICSLSESVSTAADKREDYGGGGGEVRQRVDRSPAKRAFAGNRREGTASAVKSPARRSEPSPGRVRSAPGRERRAVVPDGRKRDSGDSSGLRLRSPAAHAAEGGGGRAGLGRSPSARKTGKSPGRGRVDLPEKTQKIEDSNKEITKGPPATTNESLENPLVSLECFIFL